LGLYLQQQGLFYSVPQHLFNLPTDLESAKAYSPHGSLLETDDYQKILAQWVQGLAEHQAV
jgi:hypothetical protein